MHTSLSLSSLLSRLPLSLLFSRLLALDIYIAALFLAASSRARLEKGFNSKPHPLISALSRKKNIHSRFGVFAIREELLPAWDSLNCCPWIFIIIFAQYQQADYGGKTKLGEKHINSNKLLPITMFFSQQSRRAIYSLVETDGQTNRRTDDCMLSCGDCTLSIFFSHMTQSFQNVEFVANTGEWS